MAAKPLPKGGIFSKMVRANQIADLWGLNILVYSEANVGKTKLASQAQDDPEMADVLFFDFDGGARTVVDRDDVTFITFPTINDINQVFAAVSRPDFPFKTFVFDTVTTWYRNELELALSMTKAEHPGPREYGLANERILKVVSQWRTLAQNKGWTVIFNCHSKWEEIEEENKRWRQAALTPGLYQGITQIVDVVALYEEVGKNRIMRFFSTSSVKAKARLPESWPKPPEKLTNPTMTDLRKALSLGLLPAEEVAEFQAKFATPSLGVRPAVAPSKPVVSPGVKPVGTAKPLAIPGKAVAPIA